MLKHYSLNRLLVLVATVGFAFLLADTTIEHWEILTRELMAYVPLIFSGIGLILGMIAVLRWKEQWIRMFQIVLLGSFVVAAAGFYLHIREEDEEKTTIPKVQQEEQKEKDKPLLAPFAFGGVAVVGLLGTSKRWRANDVQ